VKVLARVVKKFLHGHSGITCGVFHCEMFSWL
jgi:hypothetical protein